MWTEDKIRRRLDGTFTRFTFDGRIVVDTVPDDFLPEHGRNLGGREEGYRPVSYCRWLPEEDTILVELRQRGETLAYIAGLLGRSEDSTIKRARYLRKNR